MPSKRSTKKKMHQPLSGTSVNCNVQGKRVPSIGTTPMPVDLKEENRRKEFGEWLRKHRTAIRPLLSQTEAAKIAGMSRAHWARLELGTSGTKRDNIPGIAKAIKSDLAQTYRRAGFDPPAAEAEGHSDIVARIASYSKELPPETQQTALELVEALWRGEVIKGNAPSAKGRKNGKK